MALLMGIAFLGHFNRLGMAVAGNAHFIDPDKLSKTQMGLVYSAFLLTYTVGMLPGGWLIDRLGPRAALAGMGLGLGLCGVLTGSLGWLGLSVTALWLPLLAIRGLAGAASVPLHPGAARSVSLWVPPAERSTANGLITAGAGLGIAFTFPVFGWLMYLLGWPGAFAVSGAALMTFALAWYAFAAGPGDAGPAGPRTSATLRECLGLLRNRNLVLLTLSYGALGYIQYLFFYWVENYLREQFKLTEADGRSGAFFITMGMVVGMGVGGLVSDGLCRWLGHRTGGRVVAVVGMGLCALFCLLGTRETDPQRVVWLLALSLGFLGACEGIFWTTAPALEPRNGGLACALVNTGGNAFGTVAPTLTPILQQQFGWTAAVVAACAVCAVGGLLWLGIDAGERERAAADRH